MKSVFGITRIFNAIKYSWAGFVVAFRDEAAFQQELILAIILFPLSLWLPQTLALKLFTLSSLLLVLMMELVNSAIEACVDRISKEYHPLAKKAKDIGSAVVFLAFVNLGLSWVFVCINYYT